MRGTRRVLGVGKGQARHSPLAGLRSGVSGGRELLGEHRHVAWNARKSRDGVLRVHERQRVVARVDVDRVATSLE